MNIKKWIIDNLKTDSLIIEAGSADGSDTLFFSEFFINGKIYSFEPIPQLYQITHNKIKNKNNVELFNYALSDKTEKTKIYVSDRFNEDWGSSSLLKPKDHLKIHPQITFKKEIEINTIKLSDFVNDKNINNIDLLWLDMQGYEPIVLISSMSILNKIKYLYTEVSLIETYEGVILYPEYKDFLIKNGFEVVFEELPWVDMGNALFKNKNL